MSKIKIIRSDIYIKIQRLGYEHVMSNELYLNTIATYSFYDKIGYIYKYSNTVPKEYKRYINWKKAVKRIFDIDIQE